MGRYDDLGTVQGTFIETQDVIDHGVRATTTFTVEVTEETRLTDLAAEYLGDARLWWVIADLNGIGYFFDAWENGTLIIPVEV